VIYTILDISPFINDQFFRFSARLSDDLSIEKFLSNIAIDSLTNIASVGFAKKRMPLGRYRYGELF